MNIRIEDNLPYVTVTLLYQNKEITLDHVILDTGSTGCVFAVDSVDHIDLLPDPNDPIHQIRGVGGTEFVFSKQVDTLTVGPLQLKNFEVEVGVMDYGFTLDGIIGLDYLLQTQAIIDLANLAIYQTE